jgi:hypothetical protein
MPAYRHYRLDGQGSIATAQWIEASSDADAIRQIRDKRLPVASEIWSGDRRIARVDAAVEG